VIITSSSVNLIDWDAVSKDPNYVVTEKDEIEADPQKNDYTDSFSAYTASKALADRFTWDFIAKHKPKFDVITINPSFVFGPPLLPSSTPDGTNYMLLSAIDPKLETWGPSAFGQAVHIQDVVHAHILAANPSVKGNQRFIVHSEAHSWKDLPKLAKKLFPQQQWKSENGMTDITIRIDNSKSKRELGLKYKSFEEIFKDTVSYFY